MKEYQLKDIKPAKERQYQINYANDLNESQLEADEIKKGPVLVIAGAGSGKTRTLVYRVSHLVEDDTIPEQILLLSFTRKAAQEMLCRASYILDERCGHVSGGTFHSFANQMLHRYAKHAGFTENFTILDRKDAEDVVGFVRNKLGFYKSKKRFPRKDTIADIISKAVNKDREIKKVIGDEYPHFLEHWEAIEKIKLEYNEYKKSKTIMDYDDLLVYLEKLYPEAKIIKLEQNYRSTQPILDFTNQVIEHAREKYSKRLFTKKEGVEKPVFIETENENFQSRFIVQRILELREEGGELGEIAVLFRSAWQSIDLEIELNTHNIPYVIYGGIKFTEAAHIKDVLSILKISYNPMDSVSWTRALLLIDGIGPRYAEEIILKIVEEGKGIDFLTDSLHNSKKYRDCLQKLQEVLKFINEPDSGHNFAEKLRIAIDFYMPLLKEKYDDYNKRQDDLTSLETIAARYKNLNDFLADLTLEPIDESQFTVTPEDGEDEKLILSTIHSAKGLEWHTVFVIYLIDRYLPSSYAIHSTEEIEEERRLLYVASTRAKQNLYLLKPQAGRYSGNFFDPSFIRFTEISRFLKEGDILDKYVEKWVLKE